MKIRWLSARVTLTVLALAGCGDNAATPEAEPEPFELEGSWLYLGPSDGPHTLTIDHATMVYSDVAGSWSSHWSIKAYDNTLHHFQVVFAAGSGTYLPVGQTMSGAYEVSGSLLTVQLANGASYPQLQGAGSCTATSDGMPIPDCRLYVRQ